MRCFERDILSEIFRMSCFEMLRVNLLLVSCFECWVRCFPFEPLPADQRRCLGSKCFIKIFQKVVFIQLFQLETFKPNHSDRQVPKANRFEEIGESRFGRQTFWEPAHRIRPRVLHREPYYQVVHCQKLQYDALHYQAIWSIWNTIDGQSGYSKAGDVDEVIIQ